MDLKPGDIGENIATVDMGLLKLGKGTRLHFLPAENAATTTNNLPEISRAGTASEGNLKAVDHPILMVTGLRNPCPQISHFRADLQERFIERDEQRKIIARRAGIMSIVEVGGVVEVGMRIVVEKPQEWEALECV